MNYWKVKAASLERKYRLEQLTAQAKQVDETWRAVMVEAGLDPAKSYRLVDADESVTEEEQAPDGA